MSSSEHVMHHDAINRRMNMPMRSRQFEFGCSLILFLCTGLLAQSHFTFTSNTGNNMTVLVQAAINPTIDGLSFSNGDEIGVFSPAGLCVGAAIWNSANEAITVWGDNDQTTAIDGIKAGETIAFRIWDVSLSKEISALAAYSSGTPNYSEDGIVILASLNALSLPSAPVLLSPSPSEIIGTDSVRLIWQKTNPSVTKYCLQIASDSGMDNLVEVDSSIADTTNIKRSLTNKQTYWWRIKAYNASGWGAFCEKQSFTIDIPTSAFSKVSHDPCFTKICISGSLISYMLAKEASVTIALYDINGRMLYKFPTIIQAPGNYQRATSTGGIPSGQYILHFQAGDRRIEKHFLLLH
jgi:hypothetical protein